MSSTAVECNATKTAENTKENDSMKEQNGPSRVRKAKKPEIQIYRPGALRQKRSNQVGDQGVKEANEGKAPESKIDSKDDAVRVEAGSKASRKGKQGKAGDNTAGNAPETKQIASEMGKYSSRMGSIEYPQNTHLHDKTNKGDATHQDGKSGRGQLGRDGKRAQRINKAPEENAGRVEILEKDNKEYSLNQVITESTPDLKGKRHSSNRDNRGRSDQSRKKRDEVGHQKLDTIDANCEEKKLLKKETGHSARMGSETEKGTGINAASEYQMKQKEEKSQEIASSHREEKKVPSGSNVQNEKGRRDGALKNERTREKDELCINKGAGGMRVQAGRAPEKKYDYPRQMDAKHKGTFVEYPENANEKGSWKSKDHMRYTSTKQGRKEKNFENARKSGRGRDREGNDSYEKVSQKFHNKLHDDFDIESFVGYEDDGDDSNQISVQALANKVDELALKSTKSQKRDRGRYDSTGDGKEYGQGIHGVGSQMEYHSPRGIADPASQGRFTEKVETKPVISKGQEQVEKAGKTKSYSSARENRKNRMGGKPSAQGRQVASQGGDLKIEVTVNKNSQERTAYIRQESDIKRNEKGNKYHLAQELKGDDTAFLHDSDFTAKSGWYGKSVGNAHADKFEREDVDPMIFVDVPEDDWGTEVDNDTVWCNRQGDESPATWTEKPDWKSKRERQRSEGEDLQRRTESPGRRGLIQLPSHNSNSDGQEVVSSSHHLRSSTPVVQKHLYNPNNPSKPVPVVPSARDMPPSREVQREVAKGAGDSVHGSVPAHNTQLSEYVIEGQSPKVDPSLLYNIQKGEMDINYYVSSNQLPFEFRRIMDIRQHLQVCYKQLLVTDIRICQEKNIEGNLWKTLYYVIIEKLREYISREPGLKDRSLATLMMLVEEGHKYLQDLLEALQREYNFTLEEHLEEGGTSNSVTRGRVRLALMSAQKLLLSLGDLARYREQYNSTPNYTLAKKWYQMALQVHPRNGRPFNQLAIIAVNQKRPLDVVYYYVRSLTASNPFMSARDSLVSMFDDIRKKYQAVQRSEPDQDLGRRNEGRALSGEGLRQEIWIRPDSGATNRRTLSQSNNDDNSGALEDLKKLTLEQLMKRFLTSYLHCHGMLFSRVGLDGFRECCIGMLREFSVLLQSSPPRLSTNHLLQILAINMYAVSNTELKDNRVGSGYRSAAQELALVLAQEMFGCLAQHVVELLPHNVQHHPQQQQSLQQQQQQQQQPVAAVDPQRLFSPTLAHFMPPLKAWCDWLLYHSAVWNPPPAAREYSTTGVNCDPWSSVAELATILRGFGPPDVPLTDAASIEVVPVKLMEDSFLRGYEPLLPAHRTLSYSPSHVHSGRACDWARVMRLQTCLCQFLCGVDPPVLRLQKTDQGDVLVSVVDTSPPDTPTASRLSLSTSDVEIEDSFSDSEPSDIEEDVEAETGLDDETPLASTVKLLSLRKKMLEKKQRQQRKLQTLLEGSVTLEMEVRPRFLVPDTNCFIEHLDLIKALVNCTPYTVMVPLVVLNELDGLSRDAAVAKYGSIGHAVRVKEGAAAALHYLRDTKPHSLKCVTSQGSVLSSTSFTAEIDMPDATNDDKILSCCVHFCSDSTQRRPIKAGVRRLYREVVLLTEDRNLRVKAHARDVPVRDLLDFAQWAGVR
ncbi:telomerase-binding protein EST1A-like isoform X2 [Penaeus chinensis]|uniref:telomerase-binding protein EST1A-like isoform X2 n=1 Tax=Penaeus chinensis TaxID=139456 RepID=UPI001FB6AF27|nr:telomerase-binding protein EST1A-like isoform X2 [Penaeus chinensis]